MKALLLSFLILFLMVSVVPAQEGAEEDTTPKPSKTVKKDKKPAAVVATALRKLKYSGSKPNAKAKFYIFLHSASYCPPCREEMPGIAKEYSKMKTAGVELVLFSHDAAEADTKAWLKSEKAKFPVVMISANKEKTLEKVPGYGKVEGIPHAVILDAEGNKITEGHGAIVKEWARYAVEKKEDNAAEEE